MKNYDLIIIGSGISGSTFAHLASKTFNNILILEKEEILGGCFKTFRHDDFQIEQGAHTCYNSYTKLLQVFDETNITNKLIPREKVSFKLYYKKSIKKISKALSFIDIFKNVINILSTSKEGLTVQEYYSTIFGKKNYESLFKYAFGAVLSQSPDNFPADTLFKKRNFRRKDVVKSFTIRGGLSETIKLILSNNKIESLTNTTVSSVTANESSYIVKTQEQIFQATHICFATPANISASLIENISSKLSICLSKIQMATIESMGIIIDSKKIKIPLITGLIPIDENFYSVVSSDTVKHDNLRGFTFHFKPEVYDQEQKIEVISNVLEIKKEDIIKTFESTLKLPILKLGHKDIISEINQELKSLKNLYLIGNYFDGLAIEDCASRSFTEFNRLK